MEMDLKHTFGALLFATLTAVAGLSSAAPNNKTFADDPAVIDFARDLEQRHGFNADERGRQYELHWEAPAPPPGR